MGDKRVVFGSWATDTTGGDIDTGLVVCDVVELQHTGDTVIDDHPVVNETLPCGGSAVTIVCTSAKSGIWMAIGY